MNATGDMEMGGTSGMCAAADASAPMAHCGLTIAEGRFLEPVSRCSNYRGALTAGHTRYFISFLVAENSQG